MITITPEAASFIFQFLKKESDDPTICSSGVKILLEKSGCNGYKYSLKTIKKEELFDDKLKMQEGNFFNFWFDTKHEDLIKDVSITLEKDLFENRVKISNDSISTTVCGCGKSFHLD